jgi:hypothetical protein
MERSVLTFGGSTDPVVKIRSWQGALTEPGEVIDCIGRILSRVGFLSAMAFDAD